MSTVAEIIEAVKELPETEKGVLFREPDPLREPKASRGSLARNKALPVWRSIIISDGAEHLRGLGDVAQLEVDEF